LGYFVFRTPEVVAAMALGDWPRALSGVRTALQTPDAWIWAYFVFAIGNTLLPSRADMHAWPLLALILFIIGGVSVAAGAGTVLLNGLNRALTGAVRWIVLLGGSTLLIDIPFFLLILLAEKGLERLRGRRIVYQ
jgi:CHASE2 domain-containing sensor protein